MRFCKKSNRSERRKQRLRRRSKKNISVDDIACSNEQEKLEPTIFTSVNGFDEKAAEHKGLAKVCPTSYDVGSSFLKEEPVAAWGSKQLNEHACTLFENRLNVCGGVPTPTAQESLHVPDDGFVLFNQLAVSTNVQAAVPNCRKHFALKSLCTLDVRDVKSIEAGQWLSDRVIMCYLENLSKTCAKLIAYFDSLIWSCEKDSSDGFSTMKFFRGNAEHFEILLIPVFKHNHWALCVFEKSSCNAVYYDSLIPCFVDNDIVIKLRSIVQHLGFDVRNLGLATEKDMNRQVDGHSCGVHVCFVAYQVCFGKPTKHVGFSASSFRAHIRNVLVNEKYVLPFAYKEEMGNRPNIKTKRNVVLSGEKVSEKIPVLENFSMLDSHDLGSLDGGKWLNDAVIMCYFEHLRNSCVKSVAYIDSIMWSSEISFVNGNTSKKYLRGNGEQFEVLLIPVFKNNHWTLCVFWKISGTAVYYDSLIPHSLDHDVIIKLFSIVEEMGFEILEFKLATENDMNKQVDCYNCGVHVCFVAFQVCFEKPTKQDNFNPDAFRTYIRNALFNEKYILPDAFIEGMKKRSDESIKRKRPHPDELKKSVNDSVGCRKNKNKLARKIIKDDIRSQCTDKKLSRSRSKSDSCARRKPNFMAAKVGKLLPASYRIGKLEKICFFCKALYFPKEKMTLCCKKGQIQVPTWEKTEFFTRLCAGEFPESSHFLKNIRRYNSLFAFASIECNYVDVRRRGPPVVKIQGEVYVRVSGAFPKNAQNASFAKYYHYDPQEAAELRGGSMFGSGLLRSLLIKIDLELRTVNLFAHAYLQMWQVYENERRRLIAEGAPSDITPRVRMTLLKKRDLPENFYIDRGVHPGCLNKPTADQVMAVYNTEEGGEPKLFEGTWVFDYYNKKPKPVANFDPNAISMLFPLIHNKGEQTYTSGMRYSDGKHEPADDNFIEDDVQEAESGNDTAVSEAGEVTGSEDEEKADKKARVVKHRSFISEREYLVYQYAFRGKMKNHALWTTRRLAQQYTVLRHVRKESIKFAMMRKKIKQLRSENLNTLFFQIQDAKLKKTSNHLVVGSRTILPDTYKGSPRHLQALAIDGISLANEFGPPDLFITFTGNPNWPEIRENLLPGQVWTDQPALVCRVYHQYMAEFLNDVLTVGIFGEVVAAAYNVEFQKRGMPHVHLLLTINKKDGLVTPEDFDEYIRAELPPLPSADDPEYQEKLRLRELVIAKHIHNPCQNKTGLPCLDEKGKCTKHYPQPFSDYTYFDRHGFAHYTRRDNRDRVILKNYDVVDNRWIVPYNPFLLLKYSTHINVERVGSTSSYKYIFKYMYKGYDEIYTEMREKIMKNVPDANLDGNEGLDLDHVNIDLDDLDVNEVGLDFGEDNRAHASNPQVEVDFDEIRSYEKLRTMTGPEAIYRDFQYKMSYMTHSFIRMAVHEEGKGRVTYVDGKAEEFAAVAAIRSSNTAFEAWFELNKICEEARQYTFEQIPRKFRYDSSRKKWFRRKREDKVLGRIYAVQPKFRERHAIRALARTVKGVKSFEELRTVKGKVYPTYFEAAVALGLLVDDELWDKTLEEASQFDRAVEVRRMFASMLVYCNLKDPVGLWEKYKHFMTDRRMDKSVEFLEYSALRHINSILQACQDVSLDVYGIHIPELEPEELPPEEMAIRSDYLVQADGMYAQANDDQKTVIDTVVDAVFRPKDEGGKCFMLEGAGGTGKTFVHKAIYSRMKGLDRSIACVAFTGCAAILLPEGRTVHSTFKLTFGAGNKMQSRISPNSPQGQFLRNLDLLIWDEAAMQANPALNEVEAVLRDCASPEYRNCLFGGVTVLLSGDWKQLLPIVADDSRAEVVRSCMKGSSHWKYFQTLTLHTNMRVNEGEREWANWLEEMGTGKLQLNRSVYMRAPPDCLVESPDELIDWLYPVEIMQNLEQLKRRAMLTVRNADADIINNLTLDRVPGEERAYLSSDEVDSGRADVLAPYTVEYVNTRTPSGMPPFKLRLKTGAIVMLLRNLDLGGGLCNGTRMVVTALGETILRCQILDGKYAGEERVIHKILCRHQGGADDGGLSFTRLQFPIRLAYCMTINKSQGQTFDMVGIYLRTPVFSHGQLYVAFSRVRSKKGIKMYVYPLKSGFEVDSKGQKIVKVRNVVYEEIFEM